jgi:ribosomal-protein-alanine N-acetyltransferase
MSTVMAQQTKVHIRWCIRRDMPEVLDIERGCFEFPWYEEDFIKCLRQRNCIGMVAEGPQTCAGTPPILGFMVYELHKTRIHVLNFAVSPECRHQGIGRQMVDKLLGKLSEKGRRAITLEVRETNLPAQLFFKEHGFRAVNVLRSFYEDSPEDAYQMRYSL